MEFCLGETKTSSSFYKAKLTNEGAVGVVGGRIDGDTEGGLRFQRRHTRVQGSDGAADSFSCVSLERLANYEFSRVIHSEQAAVRGASDTLGVFLIRVRCGQGGDGRPERSILRHRQLHQIGVEDLWSIVVGILHLDSDLEKDILIQ